MSARAIFGERMRLEDRIFIYVSAPVAEQLRRMAQREGRGAGSVARDLIVEGCADGGVPKVVLGRFRDPVNVAFTREQREMIEAACDDEQRRIGQVINLSTFARRCLHRGLEMLEERPARRKAG